MQWQRFTRLPIPVLHTISEDTILVRCLQFIHLRIPAVASAPSTSSRQPGISATDFPTITSSRSIRWWAIAAWVSSAPCSSCSTTTIAIVAPDSLLSLVALVDLVEDVVTPDPLSLAPVQVLPHQSTLLKFKGRVLEPALRQGS